MTEKFTDITDSKRVQQELTEANERLRLAMEAGSAGGFDYDLRTGRTLLFGKALSQLGMTPDETSESRMKFWNRVHEEDFERLKRAIEVAREKREDYTEDFRVVWRDGTIRWLSTRGRFYYTADGEAERLLGISLDITERKRAEDTILEMNRTLEVQSSLLRSGQELLKIFVKYAPAGVAMFDRDMRYLQVSDRWCADYSVDSSQVLGHTQYELFPDIPARWKEMHRRGLEGETLRADEDRWDRKDGTKWVRWEIRPWWNLDGKPGGILIFAEDITQRKEMELALSDVPRRLVEAQEKERARIARDLHDDINQKLALLSMDVSQLEANPSEIESRGQELRTRIGEIAADIHALAQDLHPSNLQYLGAVAGMECWCRDFAERQNLELDFRANVQHNRLPPEIGIVLFRVLQEALQNTAKHSGAKRVQVELEEDSETLHLVVRDSGTGFDVEAAARGHSGLGLVSMRERVRTLNGRISIDSKPNGGTAIEARVPFEAGKAFELEKKIPRSSN